MTRTMPQRQVQAFRSIGPDRVMGRVYRSFQRMQCFRTRSYANFHDLPPARQAGIAAAEPPPGNGVTRMSRTTAGTEILQNAVSVPVQRVVSGAAALMMRGMSAALNPEQTAMSMHALYVMPGPQGHGYDSVHVPHAVITQVVVYGDTPLRAWREYLGISRETVAERMGVSARVIRAWEENPLTPPRRSALVPLARALGIDVSRFDL